MSEVEVFSQHRPLLFSIAYRMLGSVMDAEDVVQEAFLRWQQRQGTEAAVESPKAFLSTVVTRLCIDQLRSAQARREEYVGPWLPEPLVATAEEAVGAVELADSLSLAFLVLLESLSPVERAVFLLHEVFRYPYDEVARMVGKSEANCRQIAGRARRHVEERRPRFDAAPEQQERLTRQFVHACTTGDMAALLTLLADDITLWSDGGGKVAAARRPIHGSLNVARFLLGVLPKAPPGLTFRFARINGQLGVMGEMEGRTVYVTTLDIAGERIQGIRIVANPDKLHAISKEHMTYGTREFDRRP